MVGPPNNEKNDILAPPLLTSKASFCHCSNYECPAFSLISYLAITVISYGLVILLSTPSMSMAHLAPVIISYNHKQIT